MLNSNSNLDDFISRLLNSLERKSDKKIGTGLKELMIHEMSCFIVSANDLKLGKKVSDDPLIYEGIVHFCYVEVFKINLGELKTREIVIYFDKNEDWAS